MRDTTLAVISAAALLLALVAHLAVAPAEKEVADQAGECSNGSATNPPPADATETVADNRMDRSKVAGDLGQDAPSAPRGAWNRSPGLGSNWNQYTR